MNRLEAIGYIVENPGKKVHVRGTIGDFYYEGETFFCAGTTTTKAFKVGTDRKYYTLFMTEYDNASWEVKEQVKDLLEAAIKDFGCHEEKVRNLVSALKKELSK